LLTWPFVVLTIGNLMLSIAGAFLIHLPGLLAQLGAGEAVIGRLVALLALTAALLSPLAGRVMDRYGRRIVIRTGTVLVLIATASYARVDSIGPLLYAVRIIDGAGWTMLYAAMFTYASDLLPPEHRTRGLALFGASGLVTMAISSLLGDLILRVGTYRTMFHAATAFCAIGSCLCWTLPEPIRAPREQGAAAPRVLRTVMQRDLLPIWAAAIAFFSSMAGLLSFIKTFVLHTQHGSVGRFFTAYALCALALRLFFGGIPDRVGLRAMVLPAIGSYAAGIVVLANSSGLAAFTFAGALCGVGHGYAFPVLLSLLVSRTSPVERGTATATFTTVDWTGNLLAPPLLGLLIERAGYVIGFSALAAFATLGIAAFYAFDRRSGGVPPAAHGST
jgi:MFS family permease